MSAVNAVAFRDVIADLISLSDLARRLPRHNGKQISATTIWRWIHKGVRGVKLQTWKVGGRSMTTWAAYEVFNRAIETATSGAQSAPTNESHQQARRRSRIDDAGQVLERAGIRRPVAAIA